MIATEKTTLEQGLLPQTTVKQLDVQSQSEEPTAGQENNLDNSFFSYQKVLASAAYATLALASTICATVVLLSDTDYDGNSVKGAPESSYALTENPIHVDHFALHALNTLDLTILAVSGLSAVVCLLKSMSYWNDSATE